LARTTVKNKNFLKMIQKKKNILNANFNQMNVSKKVVKKKNKNKNKKKWKEMKTLFLISITIKILKKQRILLIK